ncbi:MAG TPA: 50S ribosomal protein L23 [Bacteroidales bacterium]|nr:50S ribosomal protein L23 [Bacteroidales bacterium]HPS45869.1 50S ribosomal protein L23 [Bacteroidales bacterium]HQH18780.1 50S ribosomal protein L23 [Bacteroidales bacterium]HQI45003.1 50S ribosomal protein L23 [Bacteroidales bacterium]
MEVLVRPIITEKMTGITEKLHQYGFIVGKSTNKIQIKKAVEEMYGVNVISVNTVRYAGKSKSRYTKKGFVAGSTDAFKKAIITLKEGQVIDFYSNI